MKTQMPPEHGTDVKPASSRGQSPVELTLCVNAANPEEYNQPTPSTLLMMLLICINQYNIDIKAKTIITSSVYFMHNVMLPACDAPDSLWSSYEN